MFVVLVNDVMVFCVCVHDENVTKRPLVKLPCTVDASNVDEK